MKAEKTDGTKDYRPRIIDGEIEERLKAFGGVSIEGPEGCGKTTTARCHCGSELLLGDVDGDPSSRLLAEAAPGVALAGESPRLIDEWQKVPSLWDGVRCEIDRRADKGRFVLTQSSRPANLATFHTGIGRISRMRIRTMSLFETGDSAGEVSLKDICDGKAEPSVTRDVTLDDLMRFVMRGGWPKAVSSGADASDIPGRIVSRAVDDYSQSLDGVRYSRTNMGLILRALARNEGLAANTSSLMRGIPGPDGDGVSGKSTVYRASAARYLDFLDRLYLTENIPPFFSSFGNRPSVRIMTGERRQFCDPSLACACLGATKESLMNDLGTFVRLFESLCVHDLRVYAETFGATVYHYRDYAGREMKCVLELHDGRWCAFGIVLGVGQLDAECGRLLKTCRALERDGMPAPSSICVVCGLSNAAFRREDGVFAVPLTALRP